MFKRFFFLALTAGVFSSIIAWIYSSFYKNTIVDFTEATGFWHLLCFSLMITLGISILSAGISFFPDFLFPLYFMYWQWMILNLKMKMQWL